MTHKVSELHQPLLIGLCTARDEADVVGQVLHYAARHHDAIFCVDCGSTDETASIISEVSDDIDCVYFLGKIGVHHARQVHRHIWYRIRELLSPYDWFCMVDADEFVDGRIRQIVNQANDAGADCIFSEHVNFYYTQEDADAWRTGKETVEDRNKPIQDRRYYYCMQTSQIRLYRNRPSLRWNNETLVPTGLCKPFSAPLRYYHYQYRDLDQIAKRIENRNSWSRDSPVVQSNPHWVKVGVEDAISSNDDPRIRDIRIDGEPVRDPDFPPIPGISMWKSFAKNLRTELIARITHQEELEKFSASHFRPFEESICNARG